MKNFWTRLAYATEEGFFPARPVRWVGIRQEFVNTYKHEMAKRMKDPMYGRPPLLPFFYDLDIGRRATVKRWKRGTTQTIP